ncbi:inorganic pyrophosphatase [Pseudozyma hubeiensis SY62]|uniref:Inorganic pyrophosphatase n=1 Tax=Pseudozyma hubeiensis (strain SY62) TaxID=1305764 RepID=R9PG71_PSEHS|nr:inorganic pyrophosphatase [Pseudozyma hubeiensis SY62]GAC97115.1 inorganic pyrophosphatase [Pseudozyma hubeiensis SY62]
MRSRSLGKSNNQVDRLASRFRSRSWFRAAADRDGSKANTFDVQCVASSPQQSYRINVECQQVPSRLQSSQAAQRQCGGITYVLYVVDRCRAVPIRSACLPACVAIVAEGPDDQDVALSAVHSWGSARS